MARTITKTDRQITAQWRASWALLPHAVRCAIARFCLLSDMDVAEAVFRGGGQM